MSGTGDRVGKTLVTTALAAHWLRYGRGYGSSPSLGLLKLLECSAAESAAESAAGSDRDSQFYARTFNLDQTPDQYAPLQLSTPNLLSSLTNPGNSLNFQALWQTLSSLSQTKDWVLAEGPGGLGTPLSLDTTLADLAWDWRLPTLLVVPLTSAELSPEPINAAIAQIALARQSRCPLQGIILNSLTPAASSPNHWQTYQTLLTRLSHLPVLGTVPYLSDPEDLEKLIPIADEFDWAKIRPS